MDGWTGILVGRFSHEHSVLSGAGQRVLRCGQCMYEYDTIEAVYSTDSVSAPLTIAISL